MLQCNITVFAVLWLMAVAHGTGQRIAGSRARRIVGAAMAGLGGLILVIFRLYFRYVFDSCLRTLYGRCSLM
jgi:hypothetical protein